MLLLHGARKKAGADLLETHLGHVGNTAFPQSGRRQVSKEAP